MSAPFVSARIIGARIMSAYRRLRRRRPVRAGRAAVAALACVLAGDIAASAQAAPSGETTVFTVIVTRHGVRAISDPPGFPGYAWADWSPVGKDELTAHGYRLMRLMGEFYSKEQAGKRLPVNCDAKSAYVYADVPPAKPPANPDPAQRTLGTAHALIEGLCGKPDKLAVFHAADLNKKDPIFDATEQLAQMGRIDGAASRKAVERAAAPVSTIVARHAAEFAAFQKVLDTRCCTPVSAGESAIKPDKPTLDKPAADTLAALTGPIATASAFSEDVFLEFAQCRPEDEIAKLDRSALHADLDAGMQLHVVAYDVNARNYDPRNPDASIVYNPLVRGGTLLAHIAAMLDKKVGYRALDKIGAPDLKDTTLVIFSGHDTQLGALGGILNAHWTPGDGIVRDDMPPGSALIFDLVKAPGEDDYQVRLYFVSRGRDAFRDEMPFKGKPEPARCPDDDCVIKLRKLEKRVLALDKQGLVVAGWNASSARSPQDPASFADPSWTDAKKCQGHQQEETR